MRTTIEIADCLLAEARRVAAREATTLRALVEAGLRRELAMHKERKRTFRLRGASFGGQGLQPGVREGSWEILRDLIYKGRGA